MGFKRFSIFVAIRTALIMLALLALVSLLTTEGYHAATILVLLLLAYQCIELVNYVSKTNAELVRFFDAARYADFSQRFELAQLGSGFGELGEAFTDILKRIQKVRAGQEQELKHLKAMVEHVPVPLLSLQGDGKVVLWNNSARRFFGSHQVNKVDDLARVDTELARQIQKLNPGERKLVNVEVDKMPHQLTLAGTQLTIAGQNEMLISMQDIQSELDGAQLQAWQDLVRVLTHEIMNSITPVASLAKTAVDLVEDVKAKTPQTELVDELEDVSDAVNTVARRSDALMQFVGSYRRLTRLPPPNKQQVAVTELFAGVKSLMASTWKNPNVHFTSRVTPESLTISADKDMIEQLLINLLINAEQALSEHANPSISLSAELNKRGHVVIDVSDNGDGVPEDIKQKIFVPFFTTKRDGSGVGLALTRQVMIAHGGNVKLESSDTGGAKFMLTF